MKSQGPSLDASNFSLVDQVKRVAKVARTIIGAPDYERYLEHVRECHPDRTPLTRDEFAKSRMDSRYNQPGNRCC